MTYRIIALDVDGTLLNDDHCLTARVRESVRAAARGGAEIVLCTGRGRTGALAVLDELGLAGTMITHNGASIVESDARSVLFEKAIPTRLVRRYVDFLQARGIHYDMNTSFDLFVNRLGEEAALMYESLRARPILRPETEGLPEGMVKLSVYAPEALLDDVESIWRQWGHELQCIRSGTHFIDIQHAEATKGNSLEQLANLRGVPREEVLAIGNYYNDIGMLAYAGRGVAMGNAPTEVKAAADEMTAGNNEDGVALVLERLLGA